MHAFHIEMHKTADFHSKLLVYLELLTEGYQGRPKCAHFRLNERSLPGMVILWSGCTYLYSSDMCIMTTNQIHRTFTAHSTSLG